MSRPPLGQVCVELGLLEEAQVERILQDMRTNGQGRFGELAVGLNLLSEEDLARALAAQFHVPILTVTRLANLSVPREVLALLPVSLMRGKVLLPTFLEPDRRTLSIVTSDPTDLPALQAAQHHARADRLRIFVAARSELAAQLDRILPTPDVDDDGGTVSIMPTSQRTASTADTERGDGTVVLETDVELAGALRRLSRAEGTRSQIVEDPEQVTAILRAAQADRVFYREALGETVSPYLTVWRKVQPGVQVAGVRGFSPGRRVAVSYLTAQSFYQQMLLWLLASTGATAKPAAGDAAVEDAAAGAGDRMRKAYRLAIALGAEVQLADEQIEAASMAAMMEELNPSDGPDQAHDAGARRSRTSGRDVLARFSAPWDLDGLLAAVDRRRNRPLEPTTYVAAELLLMVHHAVARGIDGATDASDVLQPGVRYPAPLRTALTRVLQRRAFRAQVLTAGRRRALVVVAARDALLLTDVERRLDAAGFEVHGSLNADAALDLTRSLHPCAVVISADVSAHRDADSSLPATGRSVAQADSNTPGARRLLAEIRHDSPIADTPVIVLSGGPAQDGRDLRALKPNRILPEPHDLSRLEASLRRSVAARGPADGRRHTATSDTRVMPLEEVFALLAAGRQTAGIKIAAPEGRGIVHVVEGRTHSARFGALTGDDAWRTINGLQRARFAVAFGKRPDIEDKAEILAEILASVGVAP